jgi:glycosyltransferase involved in cell wall biosynthesis
MTHVGLICHGAGTTGNERYMVELIRALLSRDDDLEYTIFYTRESVRHQLGGAGRKVKFQRLRPESAWIRATISLPWTIRRSGVALVHGQYGIPPLTTIPAVVTVADIFVAERPDLYPLLHRLQLLYRIPRALNAAQCVIVPSEFTKQDIVSRYHVDPVKLQVIPLGASERFKLLSRIELERTRNLLHLPNKFILFVGALQPRKNLARLVSAFAAMPSEIRRTNPLLIAGPEGWMYADLQSAAQPLIREGTLRFLGYVGDEEVPALMNLATVFAFPSLSEGFGLPAIEAMRCGACLLAGRAGSLPEIIGEAGMLIDPFDTEAIRQGLTALLEDAPLRERLRERGIARASTYTWDRTAEATAGLYQEILQERGQRRTREIPCPV